VKLDWVFERSVDLYGLGFMIAGEKDRPFGVLILLWKWSLGFGIARKVKK
jgi:hypothetical protein